MPSDFSKRIKLLRHKYGLSQQQFADLIDVSVPLLKQWENSQSHPSTRYWQRIVLAEAEGIQALREDGSGSHLVRESSATYTFEPEAIPAIDFSANPDVVRTVVEGERLTYGHLFNPAF